MTAFPPAPPPPPLDARTAKAQAKAMKAQAKALRPWYKKKRIMLPLGLVAIVIVIVATGGGSKTSTTTKTTSGSTQSGVVSGSGNKDHPPQADVTITKCSFDSGFGTANLSVLNHSSGQSDYLITVAFDNAAGVQVGSGIGVLNNVDGGQKAVSTADGTIAGSAATCVLKQVDRTASAG
jgi:hypothetical protein